METEGRESPGSCEERERESRLPAGRRGAWLSGCESLRRLDSAAESRSGDKSRGAEEQIVDSLPWANRDPPDYCSCVYIVYTLLIPKYTVYTFAWLLLFVNTTIQFLENYEKGSLPMITLFSNCSIGWVTLLCLFFSKVSTWGGADFSSTESPTSLLDLNMSQESWHKSHDVSYDIFHAQLLRLNLYLCDFFPIFIICWFSTTF